MVRAASFTQLKWSRSTGKKIINEHFRSWKCSSLLCQQSSLFRFHHQNITFGPIWKNRQVVIATWISSFQSTLMEDIHINKNVNYSKVLDQPTNVLIVHQLYKNDNNKMIIRMIKITSIDEPVTWFKRVTCSIIHFWSQAGLNYTVSLCLKKPNQKL